MTNRHGQDPTIDLFRTHKLLIDIRRRHGPPRARKAPVPRDKQRNYRYKPQHVLRGLQSLPEAEGQLALDQPISTVRCRCGRPRNCMTIPVCG